MRLFQLILLIFLTNKVFAFEGIIYQTYVHPISNESQKFTWYVSNDKIRLDIQKEDGKKYSILPNLINRSLSVLLNEAGEDGKYWYFDVPLKDNDSAADIIYIEEEASKFNERDAIDVKLLSERGLITLQYLPSIDFNTVFLGNYFTETEEFSALKMINIASGFPINAMLISTEGKSAVYTLKTTKIEEISVSSLKFEIPANYNLYTAPIEK